MTTAWKKARFSSLDVRSACLGKRKWRSQRAAQEALSRIRREFPDSLGSTVRPYKCPFCRGFHAGHEQ